jgi:hypothetical protein
MASLNYEGLTDVQENTFWETSNLETLEISYTNIRELRNEAFSGLEYSLKVLTFADNRNLYSLDTLVFRRLKVLERLKFLNMKLLQLEGSGALAGIAGLKVFAAVNCFSITSIQSNLFVTSNQLEEVSFELNSNLIKIEEDAFIGCASIKKLNLIELRLLGDLQTDRFVGLDGLTDLTITNEVGGVKKLARGVFVGLQAMQRVTLHLASLISVEANIFEDCSQLEEVSITGATDLTMFPTGLFNGVTSTIKRVVFGELGLIGIMPELFANMDNVDTLIISCWADLTELVAGQFSFLPNLVRLSLGNNERLAEIAPQTFKGLKKLQELDITGHKSLRRLEAGTFDYAFDFEASSVVLNLESNALDFISPSASTTFG